MTKEVVEKIVRGITDKIECNTVDIDDWAEFWGFTREEYEEFLDVGVKALESQPCEDCISREDALRHRRLIHDDDGIGYSVVRVDEIIALPSVTPKAKTGHWIDIMVGDMPAQACDQCKTFYPLSYTGGGHNYCPSCGSRMVEPQESEDKE